jgi:hypothetical protein
MKLILLLIIITGLSSLASAVTCRNDFGTCTAVDSAQGCRMDPPRACFIVADGQCYKIINSTGQSVFVPAKTGSGEWASFYNNLPAGVTKDVECWP